MASKKKCPKAVARGRSNRNKGKVYEREIVHALRSVYPHCARGIGQSRDGAERPDVVGTPFWVECGAGTTIKIPVKLRQALNDSACSSDDTYAGAPALVFTRSSRGEHIVSMERGQLVALLAELERLKRVEKAARELVEAKERKDAVRKMRQGTP